MLDFVLTALATHRVTRLVIEDEIVSEPREALFAKFPPQSTKLGYLLTCPWCVSFWVAIGFVSLDAINPKAGKTIKTVLAASSVTGIIDR